MADAGLTWVGWSGGRAPSIRRARRAAGHRCRSWALSDERAARVRRSLRRPR